MHVKEVMTHPVVTCQIGDHLDVPARLMWEYDCGVIPVVGHEGRLEGVITDRDITMAALTNGERLDHLPVEGAMAKHALVVHPEESVEGAERLMREGQVRRLPVVDNAGRPEGLVSINDLARLSAKARRSGVEHELVQTFAAICQPRVAARAARDRSVFAADHRVTPPCDVTVPPAGLTSPEPVRDADYAGRDAVRGPG